MEHVLSPQYCIVLRPKHLPPPLASRHGSYLSVYPHSQVIIYCVNDGAVMDAWSKDQVSG